MKLFKITIIFIFLFIISFFIGFNCFASDDVFYDGTGSEYFFCCHNASDNDYSAQTFTATENNITKLSTYVKSLYSGAYIKILDNDTSETLLDTSSNPITTESYYTFDFDTIPTTVGNEIEIRIYNNNMNGAGVKMSNSPPAEALYFSVPAISYSISWATLSVEIYYDTAYTGPGASLNLISPKDYGIWIAPPTKFEYSYTNPNQEWNYVFIELNNISQSYTVFKLSEVASTTDLIYAEYKTPLEDSSYQWRMYFVNDTTSSSTPTEWEQFDVAFNVDSPYIRATSTPDFTAIDFTDSDFGFFGNAIRDVVVWLFYPSTESLELFDDLKTELFTKAPFGYFTSAKTLFNNLTITSGTAPALESNITIKGENVNLKILDFNELEDIIGSNSLTLFRNFLKYVIYLLLLFYFYFRITHIMSTL